MNQNTAITSTEAKPSAMNVLAARLECDPNELAETLKKTVFKNASDAEYQALVIISNSYELNPILKELYAFPAKGGGIVPVVSIDGWLKIINRQPNFDGMTVEISEDGSSATCSIHVKGRAHPTIVTEYLSECARATEPWKTMPKRMLRHKAIIQGGRVAFGLGGIQDEDEAADTMRNVTPNEGKKITVREEAIDPFNSPTATEESEEQEEPAPANPETKPATGRQKKDRGLRDAKFKKITEKGTDKKPWFEVLVAISGKDITLSTFSQTLAGNLREVEAGTMLRITVVPSGEGFAIEDFAILNEEAVV